MNATTRYILTATAVGAGLLTIGATANALAGNNAADAAPIGPAVIVPSSDPVPNPTVTTGPEVIDPPIATDLDDTTPSPGSTDFGTSTPPAGGLDDDEGVEIEGDD
jgi:hypothetical protein